MRHVGGLWLLGGEVGVDVGVVSFAAVSETGTASTTEGEVRASTVRGRVGVSVAALAWRSVYVFVEPRVSLGWLGARGRGNERWRSGSFGAWTASASLAIGAGVDFEPIGLELVGEIGWARGVRATADDGTPLAELHGALGQLALRVTYGSGG
jgi:hypothetical protein